MRTVTVNASKTYQIMIGSDLLSQLGSFAADIKKPCKAAIISDSNVWPLYGNCAKESLESAGFQTCHCTFDAGEASKCIDTYFKVLCFLAENQLTRTDLIIALGGGVVGDLAGFAAATYLRGIDYIQVPTSLLAMVDSSVGGKTAIDLPIGKNLVGAFYQPRMVVCDVSTLSTLPEQVFRDGCAEVIKYGILYDDALFSQLENSGLSFDREHVVARCVELKRDIVNADEFEKGERQQLNLGHTVGHGVESCSQFTISHGHAVAIGTAIIARAACNHDICDKFDCLRILDLLQQFALPVATHYAAELLCNCALSDKKRSGNTVNLIVPVKIGKCITRPTPISELQTFIEAGL